METGISSPRVVCFRRDTKRAGLRKPESPDSRLRESSRVIDEIRTPRAIACITNTNAAVQEIESRLRHHLQPGDDAYYDIGTIHSFCLNHVFRPFCYLINGYKGGFKVLTPESAEFERHVTAICAQHGRYNLTFKDFEDFTQLRVSLDGKPVGGGIERGALTPVVAVAYWKRIRGQDS